MSKLATAMMKTVTLLTLLLFLSDLGIVKAESRHTTSLDVKIRGLSDYSGLIPEDGFTSSSTSQTRKKLGPFTIYLPGFGRYQVNLLRRVRQHAPALFSDQGQHWVDPKGVTYLKGKAYSHGQSFLVAGSIYRRSKIPQLFLLLAAAKTWRPGGTYLQITVPLGSAQPTVGRVVKSRQLSASSNSCGVITVLPTTLKTAASRLTTTALPEARLRIYGDGSFYALHGSDSNAVISSITNAVEIIYEEQLGLNLLTAGQEVFTDLVVGSNRADEKLEVFANYVNSGLLFGQGTADAYHLFSAEDFDGATIGLAYQVNDPTSVGVVCRYPQYSFSISQYKNTPLSQLTFAHELGHNFGAIHPEEDRVSFPIPPPQSIMTGVAPSDPTDDSVRQFSQYSVDQIAMHAQLYGSCLTSSSGEDPTPPVLAATLSTSGYFNAQLAVTSSDPFCSLAQSPNE